MVLRGEIPDFACLFDASSSALPKRDGSGGPPPAGNSLRRLATEAGKRPALKT